ncbi:hypothetical protein OJ998_19110 [Solirubrobacter taibaiensis]|nr:hypothetical protein [Solirubrobacter taibaiensis]
MSYDLHAFRVPPGFTVEEWYENEERELATELRPPTEVERAAMERLAADVLALDPTAERHDFPTHIEITNADAVQVSIFHEDAAVSVPYWHDGEHALEVMFRMQEYAQILTEAGLSVYDPQTGDASGPADGAAYASGVEATRRIAERIEADPPPPPKRRRWPFGRS